MKRYDRSSVITNRYDTLRNSRLGVRLAKSRIGVRITGSPLYGRITKFAISSAFAAGTSAVVFPVLYVLGAPTTVCTSWRSSPARFPTGR